MSSSHSLAVAAMSFSSFLCLRVPYRRFISFVSLFVVDVPFRRMNPLSWLSSLMLASVPFCCCSLQHSVLCHFRPLRARLRFLVRILQISAVREMWLCSAAEDGQVQSLEHEGVDLRSVPGAAVHAVRCSASS